MDRENSILRDEITVFHLYFISECFVIQLWLIVTFKADQPLVTGNPIYWEIFNLDKELADVKKCMFDLVSTSVALYKIIKKYTFDD